MSSMVATTCHHSPPRRATPGPCSQAAGLLGAAHALLDGAGEFFHRGSRLLQVAGGLLGAGRQVLVARRDLGAGGRCVRALAHWSTMRDSASLAAYSERSRSPNSSPRVTGLTCAQVTRWQLQSARWRAWANGANAANVR